MIIKYATLVILACTLVGCSGQTPSVKHANESYKKTKAEYETMFVKHFPSGIDTDSSLVVSNLSPTTNKLSLYLYEFGSSNSVLDSVTTMLEKEKTISYTSKDTCLFIIYPNETIDPFDDEPLDNVKKDLDCLQKKHPIPNFIDYQSSDSKSGFWLDSTFKVFVIESKKGNQSKNDMPPLKFMPKGWENGFSRGIALSKERKVLIYWSIIW